MNCKKSKIRKVMHEFKIGDLKTSHGYKVLERPQAIAIALSEAKKKCGAVSAIYHPVKPQLRRDFDNRNLNLAPSFRSD